MGFPGGPMVKNLPANAGDMGSIYGGEDPTCGGATKPSCYNYWACALEPGSQNYWSSHAPEPMLHRQKSHQNEKPAFYN